YHLFHRSAPFTFRNGEQIPELQIAYETWGHLNNKKDNVILLQCGMSASSHACSHARNPAPGWWEEYIGPGRPLDTNLFYVICTNNLGGCYGSSGPSAINSHTGQRYGSSFPRFEVQDQVAAQFVLLDHLGIDQVHACVGASLGGMQSVCAASMFPDRVRKFVSISACAKSFPGSIAFRHAQRQAIMSDPNWRGGDYYDGQLPANGLRLARQLGTITYRSGLEWQQRFGQSLAKGITKREGLKNEFMIENYLAHQGELAPHSQGADKSSLEFAAKISDRAMDGFSLEKPDRDHDGKPSLLEGLKEAMMPALVIGVQHDVLFPVWQQKEIADTLRKAGNKGVVYYELDSIYGHDSFLLDAVSIGPAVKGHLEQEPDGARHIWEELASSAVGFLQDRLFWGEEAEVERDRLKAMVKLVWSGRVNEAPETNFSEKRPYWNRPGFESAGAASDSDSRLELKKAVLELFGKSFTFCLVSKRQSSELLFARPSNTLLKYGDLWGWVVSTLFAQPGANLDARIAELLPEVEQLRKEPQSGGIWLGQLTGCHTNDLSRDLSLSHESTTEFKPTFDRVNVKGTGSTTHRSGHTTQRSGYPTQRSGYPTQRSGYTTQRSGYTTQRSGYYTQRSGYSARHGSHSGHSSSRSYSCIMQSRRSPRLGTSSSQVSLAISTVPPAPSNSGRDVILCIGDSLTAGKKGCRSYPSLLQRLLDEEGVQVKVHSSGVWGETSQDVLKRLPSALQSALAEGGRLAFVLVLAGTNDLLHSHPHQLDFRIPQIVNNIRAICETAANAAFFPHVGVLTLPPLASRNTARLKLNQQLRYFMAGYATQRGFSKRFLVDLESLNPDLAHDGVHFHDEGYMEFARRTRNAILPILQAEAASKSRLATKSWTGSYRTS
ncbi:Serine O-succinyltransferase (SST), partial [Durusdinium trenchii]